MKNNPLLCVVLLFLIMGLSGQELYGRQILQNRPKLLVQKMVNKSKLSTIAFVKEDVIAENIGLKPFTYKPDEYAVGAIVESLGGLLKGRFTEARETLENLRRFVEEGGRAAMLLCGNYSYNNSDFQELFSISIINEPPLTGSIPGTQENVGKRISIKGDDYCPLFKGLTITGAAVKPVAWKKNKPIDWKFSAFFGSSLVTVGEEWVCNFITIGGEKKCLSAWRRLGKGEILFLISFEQFSDPIPFFNDGEIDVGENLEAAMRLVRWLAGKTQFPGTE